MSTKTVILEVEESKAQSLVDALGKRDYISVVSMDRDGRKRFRDCPCCGKRLSKEVSFTVNEKLLQAMLGVVQRMSVAKSVILVNKDNPIELMPEVEKKRCVEFDAKLLGRAETLGLLTPFVDGARKTHFTKALDFLVGAESHEPSTMVTLDGEVLETSGAIAFDEVKFKDDSSRDRLKKEFRRAVDAIPSSTITFVEKGQMSLV